MGSFSCKMVAFVAQLYSHKSIKIHRIVLVSLQSLNINSKNPRRHQTFQSFDIPFFRQIRLNFTLWKDLVPNYNFNFQATLLTWALDPWLQSTWLYHRLCQFRQLPPPRHRVRRLRSRLQRLPHPLSAIISSPPTPWEKSLMDSPDHLHWHFLRYTIIR